MGVWISTRPNVMVPGVLDSSQQEAHITLAYLDKRGYRGNTEKQVFNMLKERLVQDTSPKSMVAYINGLATWIVPGGPEPYYLVALVSSNHSLLHRWREEIMFSLDPDFQVNTDYPFLPHITIGCTDLPYSRVPILENRVKFNIDNLYVSRGSNHHERIW